MIFWKRTLPLAIAFCFGILMLVIYFVPHQISRTIEDQMSRWGQIISAFALVVGLASLLNMHITRIRRRVAGWGYSVVTITALVVYTVLGFVSEGSAKSDTPFGWGYNWVYVPLMSTMFSVLAFFIASAAYRAFRARSIEASILLVVAVVVMLERVPLGAYITDAIPQTAQFIMQIPNMAARRAIFIGIALGVVATSLRIILGIERAYLGGGD